MAAQSTATFPCRCGQVTIEASGRPITSLVCYCDDCQEGARQIQSLPGAAAVLDPDGGTAYLAYRKDRVQCVKGATLLTHHKIRATSATNRVVASCCNTAMYLNFEDGKHWVDLYRARCRETALPVQMRICTKFASLGDSLPTDVPSYSRYPMALLMRLLLAKAAMVFGR